MDENTALNDTTNATIKDQEWKKKGYTSLVVSLALLLVVAFYAGQSRGARTSLAGSGGTASLMMLSNDADSMEPPTSICFPITDVTDCVKAKDNDDVQCVWNYSCYLGRYECTRMSNDADSMAPPKVTCDCITEQDACTFDSNGNQCRWYNKEAYCGFYW